ncbi:membrane protein [Desulfosporosinus sp. HMP52]|uniref:CPCC family cysteine-rich protein n=1 Tax=Desulfosporosinus sp. HMP52 TaxID=1487923 RepID=UPI00051FC2D7|nr:CPCC family cysteine-rich protein [Desulfosporosinus sp. HMP52]KGK85830.1 membrane protein [Desulfosporosinus sp. HMP52]
MRKYTCPCCGYKTLDNKPPGTYDICPICFWEDDWVQFDDPDYKGGANDPSLREAQRNFQTIGAYDEGSLKFVRKPNQDDEKDLEWKPLNWDN